MSALSNKPMVSTTLCPSSRCEDGAILLGVVQEDGSVSLLSQLQRVDEFFVKLAHEGRAPEKRFRFAGSCLKSGCQQWTGSRCGVVDRVLADNPEHVANVSGKELPCCSIRQDCRWYQQIGPNACGICPLIVTDLTARLLEPGPQS